MTLPKTTLAMVQTAPRTLEPMDLPMPEISDDSGLVRIEACGICGSDYEQFEGVLRTPMPAVPGHEPLGVVAKIGDRAAKRWGVDVGKPGSLGRRPFQLGHRIRVSTEGGSQGGIEGSS